MTPVEGKTQAELYKKALDWVQVTFKNPREVIKAQIENDYIRIEGSSNDLYCENPMGKNCFLTRYQVEITFKDGKYKFEVLNIEFYAQGWETFSFPKCLYKKTYLKDDGEVRSFFKYYYKVPKYFNDLNKDLQKFELNTSLPSKSKDW